MSTQYKKESWFTRLSLAIKAFIKAFKEPQQAHIFLTQVPTTTKGVRTPDQSHLRLIFQMQQAGRFIDFIKEDLTPFSDAQVGAVARKIHQDCGKIIEDLITIRPLRDEPEGSTIQVPRGYQAEEIKVFGNVKGTPPFNGSLMHRGWKAHKLSLPKVMQEGNAQIICPAEVEIKNSPY